MARFFDIKIGIRELSFPFIQEPTEKQTLQTDKQVKPPHQGSPGLDHEWHFEVFGELLLHRYYPVVEGLPNKLLNTLGQADVLEVNLLSNPFLMEEVGLLQTL